MSSNKFSPSTEQTALQKTLSRLLYSRVVSAIANVPPFKKLIRRWTERQISKSIVQEVTLKRPAGSGLEATLKSIVDDVVHALGYVAAAVGTYEQGDAIPMRAFYIDADAAPLEQIWEWEAQISAHMSPRSFSFSDPDAMRVFIYRDSYVRNLGVWAVRSSKLAVHDDLYTFFRSIVPSRARPVIADIQQTLGIQKIIVVPLFLETQIDGRTARDIVGMLFAARRSEITPEDSRVLSAFGRQAAAAIESERRRMQIEVIQKLVFSMQTSLQNEDQILHRIVKSVVFDLGYTGAMVATYESLDQSLPVRAAFVDPGVASEEQIHKWEQEISRFTLEPVSLTDPNVSRVYIHQEKYKSNLSVRAAEAGEPVWSDLLYDLFTPVAPPASKPAVEGIQVALGIERVLAVPFYLETLVEGQLQREFVGNLFAASRSRRLRQSELEQLRIFGQQAAAGIRNARLYRESEESREKAYRYSRTAYSAAASVHTLRNHIAAFKMYLQLSRPTVDDDELKDMNINERLDTADKILRHLHDPWRETSDMPANLAGALKQALDVISPRWKYSEETLKISDSVVIQIDERLFARAIPLVAASQRLLTAAFKVLLRRSWNSVREKTGGGNIWVALGSLSSEVIEIVIRDNGVGLRPDELAKIFEINKETESTSGIGSLWIADYIRGIGGKISAQSIWQEGLAFYLALPMLPRDALPGSDAEMQG